MPKAKYYVVNEKTLAYRFDGQTQFGCLAGRVGERGHNPLDGVFYTAPGDIVREATREDFESFRVLPDGYFP